MEAKKAVPKEEQYQQRGGAGQASGGRLQYSPGLGGGAAHHGLGPVDAPAFKCRKIFVGGLPPTTREGASLNTGGTVRSALLVMCGFDPCEMVSHEESPVCIHSSPGH